MNSTSISSEMQSKRKKAIPPSSPPFFFGVCRCMCASVSVYETVRGIEHHRLEILVGSCQAQLRCCRPPL